MRLHTGPLGMSGTLTKFGGKIAICCDSHMGNIFKQYGNKKIQKFLALILAVLLNSPYN